MTKLLLGVLSAAVLGAGGLAAAVGLGEGQPAPVVSLPAASTGTTTETTTGMTTDDISGPCDEAEHRHDPRCTGATTDGDRSGRGSGSDDDNDDDDDDDDRSGSNSGQG